MQLLPHHSILFLCRAPMTIWYLSSIFYYLVAGLCPIGCKLHENKNHVWINATLSIPGTWNRRGFIVDVQYIFVEQNEYLVSISLLLQIRKRDSERWNYLNTQLLGGKKRNEKEKDKSLLFQTCVFPHSSVFVLPWFCLYIHIYTYIYIYIYMYMYMYIYIYVYRKNGSVKGV